MININANVSDGASESLQSLINSISDPTELNEVGGRSANNAAIEYHDAFNAAGGWRGNNFLGNGANRSGEFGQNIALGWNFQSSNSDGATIANDAEFYRFKVTGGTIRPGPGKEFLTIPMIADAVGRRAADYASFSNNRLFRINGKKALFEATDTGVRAVYALVTESTQRPWEGALPDEDILSESFVEGWLNGLADIIEDE